MEQDVTPSQYLEQTHDNDHAMCFKATKNKWLASLSLEFDFKNQRSRLLRTSRIGPLSVQKVFYPEGHACAHVYILHPPAGIVSGDELKIDVMIQDNAHALITTPGANRFYRARTNLAIGDSKQSQISEINVMGKGVCENFPLETIVYDGADALNQSDIKLNSTGHYIGWDISCVGLPAAGNFFKTGSFTQLTRVFIDNKLIFHDRINLNQDNGVHEHIAGLNGNSVFATLLAYAPMEAIEKHGKHKLMERLRKQIDQHSNADSRNVSVTYIRRLLVVRYLGDSAEECKAIFIGIWRVIRPIFIHKEANTPRIWLT